MGKINIKDYLYHGIVDWENYNNSIFRKDFCLDKLRSILEHRYIYMPCEFKKNNIIHNDCANPYTYYFTFAACHPDSIYASRFKKDIKEDNGFDVVMKYSKMGILLSPKLLDELTISDYTFCDKEIVIEDNISLDRYAIYLYINSLYIDEEMIEIIYNYLMEYNYKLDIIDILDGSVIKISDENKKCNKILSKKL